MTNPFNQSRYRNEHELGSAYRLVSEVHEQLDVINFLAQNLKEVRSGNIELKSDEEGKIYWRYVANEEWILWGDMTEWFEPLISELHSVQENHSTTIGELQSQVGTNSSDIQQLQENKTTQENINTDFEDRLVLLEQAVVDIQTSLSTVEGRLEALENV